jgi:heat shock protein HslJ
MTRFSPVPVALGAFLLVGAVTSTTLAGDSPSPSAGASQAPGAPTLEGTDWLLTDARLSGAYAGIPAEVVATLRMEGGQAGGSGGCNQWSAPYTLDGEALSFGAITSTLMLCDGPGGQVETFYLADLAGVTRWSIEGTTLTLTGDDGDPILAFEPRAGIALDGVWTITDYNDGQGSVVAIRDGSAQVTIADGQLSGSAGCNQFAGPIAQAGGSVTIGPLMSTEMACQPQALMTREAAVMAALEASTAVQQADGGLTFLDAAGTLQVHLAPAAGAPPSGVPSASGGPSSSAPSTSGASSSSGGPAESPTA